MSKEITVSVIMPILNEEKYIDRCIESLLVQDYPQKNMEWLFVDGGSVDATLDILNSYSEKYSDLIFTFHNPLKTPPNAMNIGIEKARGRYVIRLDAHAKYPVDYISRCVYHLENTDADNVGGVAKTVGAGFVGECNAEILSSKFGVGNSSFRTGSKGGYVDTVPFGAFKKEIFERIGTFNTELTRSEDNDINSRIREAGGKVYLAPDISFEYYCRDTLGGLLKQAYQNGNALFLTLKKNLKAMSVRHFIPFLFFLSILIMPILCAFLGVFRILFLFEMLIYFLLDFCFSVSSKRKGGFFYKLFMYPLFHLVYGLGSFVGMLGFKVY